MKKCMFILLTLTALYGNAQQLSDQQKQLLKQMGINTSNPQEALKQMQQMKQKKGQLPDFNAGGQKKISQMMGDPKGYDASAIKYYFASNASLVPQKDIKRINSISKRIFTNTEMLSNTKLLYSKLMAKIPAAEKDIITSVAAQNTAGSDLNRASVTAMMQGHGLAALGLAMQSVIAKPSNLNFQNNMAALLTQNGYPENAVPFLNKIQSQLPNNSTVLNNLGYAWLNLGAKDSAQHFFAAGSILNPNNAETTCGEGIIDELQGDPIKAGDEYNQSFVQNPSSMIDILLGKAGKSNPYDNMTFDQIKDKITIYEYFKKDWWTMPDLSNSVEGYQSDIAIMNGYNEMFKSIASKLERIEDSVRNAKDSGLPTLYNRQVQNILKPIATYYGPFIGASMNEEGLYEEDAKLHESKAGDAAYGKKCEIQNSIFDTKYLQIVNPEFKGFYPKIIEKFRVWINAFITYTMLDMNHMPKQRLLDVIYYVKLFINHAAQAVVSQKTMHNTCDVKYDENAITHVNEWELPKILCPVDIKTLISSFDYSSNANTSKPATGTVPNATVAMGSVDGWISEPGKSGTPYVNTSQGEVSSSGFNGQDTYGRLLNAINSSLTNNEPVVTSDGPVTITPGPSTRDATASNNDVVVTSDGPVTITPGPSARLAEDNLTPVANALKVEDDLAPLPKIVDDLAPLPNLAVDPKTGYVDDLAPLTKIVDDLTPLPKLIIKHRLKQWLQDQLATNCDDLKKMDPNPPTPPNPDIKKELDEDMKELQEVLDMLTKQNNPAKAQQIASGQYIMGDIVKGQQCVEQLNQSNPGWQDKIGQTGISPTIVNSLQTPGSNTGFIKGLFN